MQTVLLSANSIFNALLNYVDISVTFRQQIYNEKANYYNCSFNK